MSHTHSRTVGKVKIRQNIIFLQFVAVINGVFLGFLFFINLAAGVWWNPEKLDNNTCGYLSLMLQISSLLIRGASEGPNAAACRDLMKLLIQVCEVIK